MIGYYVHHVGAGHLSRARAVARPCPRIRLGPGRGDRTVLAPRPQDWAGPWLRLTRDDRGPSADRSHRQRRLHWAPSGDPGLRARMAVLASWLDRERPDLLVSDVSVEVALLARLHGVPVVSVVLPGHRGDGPHRLAHAVSAGLVACWPQAAVGMVQGLGPDEQRRLRHVGGLSRLPVDDRPPRETRRTVLVLSGRGGGHPDHEAPAAASGQPGVALEGRRG